MIAKAFLTFCLTLSANAQYGPRIAPNVWRAPLVPQYNQGYNWQQLQPQRQLPPIQYPPDRQIIWRSDWIPIDRLENKAALQPESVPRIYSNSPAAGSSAEAIARQYYPELFRDARPQAGGYQIQEVGTGYQSAAVQSPARIPYGYQQSPPQYRRPIQEVVANCDRRFCYFNCRLMLLGGGRCTKGGCMCYVTYLDYMGAPQGNGYAEDSIWYELTELERRLVVETMRSGVPRNPPPNRPPASGNSPWGGVTSRPPFGDPEATTADWYGGNNEVDPETRPPYVTPKPDIGGGGWWGAETPAAPPATGRPPFAPEPETARPPFAAPEEEPVTSRPPFGGFDDDDYGSSGDEDFFGSGGDGSDDDWFKRK